MSHRCSAIRGHDKSLFSRMLHFFYIVVHVQWCISVVRIPYIVFPFHRSMLLRFSMTSRESHSLLTYTSLRLTLEMSPPTMPTSGKCSTPRSTLFSWLRLFKCAQHFKEDKCKFVVIDPHPEIKGWYYLIFQSSELLIWFRELVASCLLEEKEGGQASTVVMRFPEAFTDLPCVDRKSVAYRSIYAEVAELFLYESGRLDHRPAVNRGRGAARANHSTQHGTGLMSGTTNTAATFSSGVARKHLLPFTGPLPVQKQPFLMTAASTAPDTSHSPILVTTPCSTAMLAEPSFDEKLLFMSLQHVDKCSLGLSGEYLDSDTLGCNCALKHIRQKPELLMVYKYFDQMNKLNEKKNL